MSYPRSGHPLRNSKLPAQAGPVGMGGGAPTGPPSPDHQIAALRARLDELELAVYSLKAKLDKEEAPHG